VKKEGNAGRRSRRRKNRNISSKKRGRKTEVHIKEGKGRKKGRPSTSTGVLAPFCMKKRGLGIRLEGGGPGGSEKE